jgi:hypothetical protein
VNLGSLLQAPGQLASSRFFRVGYLPTCAGVVYLLILMWAGAPGHRINFSRAWRTASHLGIGEIVLLAIGITRASVIVQPFQLALVRVLEGRFPGATIVRGLQMRRKAKLTTRRDQAVAEVSRLPDTPEYRLKRDELTQKAGVMSERLRLRFPLPYHLVRATGLGNALAAIEDTTGAAYGLDPVVTWPRLYPLLSDRVRAAVDDLRDSLDAAARLAATGVIAAAATVLLLVPHSGWWTLLALAPFAVALVSYLATIPATVAYGLALQVAFDLHRFDLLRVMRLAEPEAIDSEKANNLRLSDFLRQGVPVPFEYIPKTN